MRRAPVGINLIGKYIARTIMDPSGRTPLVRAGVQISDSLLGALLRRHIRVVWISDSPVAETGEIEIIHHQTMENARFALQQMIGALAQPQLIDQQVEQVKVAVHQIVEDILNEREVVANLTHLRAWDSYTSDHSVHVAALSVLIGSRLGLTHDELHRLGIGAILHDIGKSTIPKEVLLKKGSLTEQEYATIKTHARSGWELIVDSNSIMPTSSIVTLQHHERLDGSGYPSGLKGSEIFHFSKIVAVADVFDALRADRSYRERVAPAMVLKIMQSEAGVKMDAAAVATLLRHVAVVPNGEIVRLSNGQVALVHSQNPDKPLQPKVQMARPGVTHYEVNPDITDLSAGELEAVAILEDWPSDM